MGGGYNTDSGVFTAPVAGTYLFLVSVCPKNGDKTAEVEIIVDHEPFGYVCSDSAADIANSSTGHCVVALEKDQKVWLRTFPDPSSFQDSRSNCFSGMLLMRGK